MGNRDDSAEGVCTDAIPSVMWLQCVDGADRPGFMLSPTPTSIAADAKHNPDAAEYWMLKPTPVSQNILLVLSYFTVPYRKLFSNELTFSEYEKVNACLSNQQGALKPCKNWMIQTNDGFELTNCISGGILKIYHSSKPIILCVLMILLYSEVSLCSFK